MRFFLGLVLLGYLYWTWLILDDEWLNHQLIKTINKADESQKARHKLIKVCDKVEKATLSRTPYQKWLLDRKIDAEAKAHGFKDDDPLNSELMEAAKKTLEERQLNQHENKNALFWMSLLVIAATLL